jgi:CheY-like chemotaxis protein
MNQKKELKVLIVEQNELSARLVAKALNIISNHILIAKSEDEAVEFCRNHRDIDLILMDYKMTENNGSNVTGQMRHYNKDVIIIAQTAFGIIGNREKAIKAGCNDYISIPILKTELLN